MSSVQDDKASTEGPTKTHIRDIRNTELVSRLLAATPPYLYSALPLQPHGFFFSEMLRSFVSARYGCRPQQYHRRFKRRSHKYYAENDEWRREWPKNDEEKKEETRPEIPLELTVEKQTKTREPSPRRLSPKFENKSTGSPGPPGRQSSFVDVGTEELPKPSPCLGRNNEVNMTASNLILPPPPPMWYPPLYNPQFGVDPLNFFIDLRVSGHIYDRKRVDPEGMESIITQEGKSEDMASDKRLSRELVQRPRHLSAFSVPVRSGNMTINSPSKYFDNSSSSKISPSNHGTSYIMTNLRHVYENIKATNDRGELRQDKDDPKEERSDAEDEK